MTASVYVDAELLLMTYLTAAFPSARVCAEIPPDLANVLPCARVERIGGGDTGRSMDLSSVDVDCFAATRAAANQFANQVRTALRNAAGYTVLGATVADVTVRSFGWRPYTNTNVRSTGMSVDLTLHNHT